MENSEPIQVFIRIRPEIDEKSQEVITATGVGIKLSDLPGGAQILTSNSNCCIAAVNGTALRLTPPDEIYGTRKPVSSVDGKIYSFDGVFEETSSQEDIYNSVADQVMATVKGYNTTIFAYGVTGSGKSFTMTGNKQAPGIIPRAIGDIFRQIDKSASENDIFFFIRLSYVELYNNSFRNLLENASKESGVRSSNTSINMSGFFTELDDLDHSNLDTSQQQAYQSNGYGRLTISQSLKEHSSFARSEKIEVRESASAGVFLAGPNLRFPVTSAVEAFQLIAKGNKLRAVASTNCNEMSSR